MLIASLLLFYQLHLIRMDYAEDHKGIKLQLVENFGKLTLQTRSNFEERPDLEDVYYGFLRNLHALHPRTTSLKVIGRSYLRRKIYSFEIEHSDYRGGTIFIDAGQNGNEWESVNLALYLLKNFLTTHISLLLWLRVVFVSLVNPDGYEEAENNKTFNTNLKGDIHCPGVNIAMNFKVEGPPKFTTCDKYQGLRYFSEKESLNIKNYIEKLGDVKLYVTLHSKEEGFIAYPFAYKEEKHGSEKIAKIMFNALRDHSIMKNEKFGSLSEIMKEKFSGSSIDWACSEMKIPSCVYFSVSNKLSDVRESYAAYLEALKYGIIELQLNDIDVGDAFLNETLSKN
nr:uncharacterized protein LOC111416209 [Onthophagus taurus]